MKFWVLSDIDSAKFSSLKSIISKFSLEYPKIKVELEVKTRETMWESLFLHLRDPKNPIGDLIEIPHSWTDIGQARNVFGNGQSSQRGKSQ
jgi:hypothetical protein